MNKNLYMNDEQYKVIYPTPSTPSIPSIPSTSKDEAKLYLNKLQYLNAEIIKKKKILSLI